MSKLSKFLGVPKIIMVRGEEFKVTPLKVKDMHLFMAENPTPEKQMEISRQIIKMSLINDIPDITDEEIENMDVEVFTELMSAINEVNGIGKDDSGIRKIKDKIAQVGAIK
jgi:hypothetical protein